MIGMFRDQSLIPTEAIRLAALGFLAERDQTYAALATEVRRFVSRLVGPSLDLLGPSLELLHHEGLVTPADRAAPAAEGLHPDTLLRLTDTGREMLATLLTARLRTPFDDVSRMVLALKLRFFAFLAPAEQQVEIERLTDAFATERGRLADLRDTAPPGLFADWLDLEIERTTARIDWLQTLA